MRRIDLSVIITAHDEGILAHKTMLSVFEAIDLLKRDNYSYEIIIHIDDGDKNTINYFNRYKKDKGIRFLKNNFKDYGISRNHAITNSNGEYVVVVDAGDLVSKNFFVKSLELAKKTENNIVIHSEATLYFGRDKNCVLWMKKSMQGTMRDINILCGLNRWDSPCLAKRDIFLKCPYLPIRDGHGDRDWWFNCESESMGVRHVVCEGIVRFCRMRSDDEFISQMTEKKHWVQERTHLFEVGKNRHEKNEDEPEDNINNSEDIFHRVARKLIKPLKKNIKMPDTQEDKVVPEYVLESWRDISRIELQLYPTEEKIKTVVWYSTELGDAVGVSYFRAIEKAQVKPDYVFIVPWLRSGGADKVLLNYIKALTVIHPNWNFAVITTLPVVNIWENKLPKNAFIVDFGNNSKYLNDAEAELLFSRIVTQLGCKRLHLINSQYGYAWISNHMELIKKKYKLNVSIFGFEYVKGTNNKVIFDYMDPFLVEIYGNVDKIFTDNESIIGRGEKRCGLEEEKFRVEYQPVAGDMKEPCIKQNNIKRILWASRVSYTKCPEILCEIAKRMEGKNIQIDVYGAMGNYDESIFEGLKCVSYHGGYNDFLELPTDNYDFYLYTSSIDGLPNCLLEATMMGLPIIAPDVGGVGEFVKDGKTGLLVNDYNNVDEYIENINFAINNPNEMVKMAKSAQQLLKRRHSWEEFIKTVEKDFGV